MHHHIQCEINFSEIYRFLSNFEIENARLKCSYISKCHRKSSWKKIEHTRLNYAKYRLIKLMSASSILKVFTHWLDTHLKIDSTSFFVDPKIYFYWYFRHYAAWNACYHMQRCKIMMYVLIRRFRVKIGVWHQPWWNFYN